ncbi:MAG TPA: hypothetical protein VFG69_13605 [Nannocystaceae bacterium]|nr:hypothetical protein [Nannocystaceae bacterium]
MRELRFAFVIAAACSSVACQKSGATAPPEPVASEPDCELGSCMTSDAELLSRDHSPLAGTITEGASECPYAASELPPKDKLVDDKHIPEFNRGRARNTNYAVANKRVQDIDLHEQLLGVQGRIFECIDLLACYDDEAADFPAGELDFQFELEPNGKVSAVSVQPSKGLEDPIVRACARRSLYEFEFPSWQGARMVVSYRLEIGEG